MVRTSSSRMGSNTVHHSLSTNNTNKVHLHPSPTTSNRNNLFTNNRLRREGNKEEEEAVEVASKHA